MTTFPSPGIPSTLSSDASKATGSKSTANEIQLRQDFAEIAALRPAPQMVFFAGDIVMGLAAGTRDLKKQLPRWVELVTRNNPVDISTTRVIAFERSSRRTQRSPVRS